jgi:hypothetical protein
MRALRSRASLLSLLPIGDVAWRHSGGNHVKLEHRGSPRKEKPVHGSTRRARNAASRSEARSGRAWMCAMLATGPLRGLAPATGQEHVSSYSTAAPSFSSSSRKNRQFTRPTCRQGQGIRIVCCTAQRHVGMPRLRIRADQTRDMRLLALEKWGLQAASGRKVAVQQYAGEEKAARLRCR